MGEKNPFVPDSIVSSSDDCIAVSDDCIAISDDCIPISDDPIVSSDDRIINLSSQPHLIPVYDKQLAPVTLLPGRGTRASIDTKSALHLTMQ